MRYLASIVGLIMLLSISIATAGNFNVIMDVNSYVDSAKANESFSSEDTLWATSADDKPAKEVYLSFLNNFVTAMATTPENIESATLKLYAASVEEPGEITAYFVQGPILETISWNNKPEYDSGVSAKLTVEEPGEYVMDVTPLIKKAVESCPGECGYTIVLIADGDSSIGFASKNTPNKPLLKYSTPV